MHNNVLTTSDKRALQKQNVIARLNEGMAVVAIIEMDGYPDYPQIIRWAEKDDNFAASLRVARIASGHRAAEQANKVVQDIIDEEYIDPKLVGNALVHLRWQAERMARETYGQQLEVKHSGTVHVRTSFLIPRTKQSVDEGEYIDIDAVMQPAQLEAGLDDEGDDDWMG